MYIWEDNLAITVPADVLESNGAWPSAGTILTTISTSSHVFYMQFIWISLIPNHLTMSLKMAKEM